jgi:chemotaxis protein CheD
LGELIVVGVGEMALCNTQGAQLVTYGLGSCLAVAIHDPLAKVGGVLHLMLPDSRLAPHRALERPAMFADTGLPRLFREAYALGARKGRLRVVVVGGSNVMDSYGSFNIGSRNYAAVRRLFWRNNILIDAEDVGGTVNRTLGLEVGSGRVWIKTNSADCKDM